MYQYPHVSQLFILLPWQSRVYPEPLKVVEFVQLTTECCWGQPSDPCQRGCLTSHACVMWGPRTLTLMMMMMMMIIQRPLQICTTHNMHHHKYALPQNYRQICTIPFFADPLILVYQLYSVLCLSIRDKKSLNTFSIIWVNRNPGNNNKNVNKHC